MGMGRGPLNHREMLEQEYESLHGSLPLIYCKKRTELLCSCDAHPDGQQSAWLPGEIERKSAEIEVELTQLLFKQIHGLEKDDKGARSALCLSGGGIRSATFALGVLQSLARRGLLGKFDYLSTVSGGGYIGSWLSSWYLRQNNASGPNL